MKYLNSIKKIGLLFSLICITHAVVAQDSAWTEKTAAKWLKSNEWKNGLKLKPHPSINKIEFAQQYHKNKAGWDKAFAFLRDSDLANLKPGKYVIDGDNVYATITDGPEKDFDKTAWESHRKYIDLQYVIRGKEKMGVAPVSLATVIKPYNATSDAANYTADGQYYIAEPGTFLIFFPTDAHRPGIKVDGFDLVRKIVIKIKLVD